MVRGVVLLLLAGLATDRCPDPPAAGHATDWVEDPGELCVVESITDGDTLRCDGGRRVRLLLIDTPEMDQEPFGAEAREVLMQLAPVGTHLRMEFDVRREDRYGRTLAYLHDSGGRMLNREMARSGYALALTYPPNVRHVDLIRSSVDSARAEGVGLWATSAFECSPVDHRAGRCSP